MPTIIPFVAIFQLVILFPKPAVIASWRRGDYREAIRVIVTDE